jgi:signal transduction histidine kinase
LGIDWQFAYFWLIEEGNDDNTFWITWPDHQTSSTIYSWAEADESFRECLIAWRQQTKIHATHVPVQDVPAWLETFERITNDAGGMALEIMTPGNFKKGVYYYDAMIKFGSFGILTNRKTNDEEQNIQCRFATEFERAYTRFLDLKKAEAQAREAQIELGLERVRARAMAMQKSDELSELVDTVFKELTKLDFALTWCIINIIDEGSLSNTVWAANPDINKPPESYHMLFEDYPFHHAMMKGYKERRSKHVYVLEGQEKKIYDEYLFNETEFRRVPAAAQAASRAMEKYVVTFTFSNFGGLQTVGDAPLSDANLDILSRFGKVFDLTYTRFNDLQKAEAQAREAQIEASLERVRSKAMAMHKSDDLNDAVSIVFEEMDKLNLAMLRCGITIFNREKRSSEIWTTTVAELGRVVQVSGDESMDIHPLLQGDYAAWLKQEDFSYVLKGEDMSEYYRAVMKTNFRLPESQIMVEHAEELRQYYFAAMFEAGSIFAFSETEFPEEAEMVMKRFANVFNLTYKRFLDLQKAEKQTREALIEGALERVRARALAMQQPEELKDVAQVMRNEMGALGVEELETSSIYIHGDSSQNVECWYALQDPKHSEKKMVADHFTLDLNDTWVGREMKRFYSSDEKQTSIVMTGTKRREWIEYCYKHSPVFTGFYGEIIPDRTYHLYKFSHGYIGAAAPGDISNESWKLLARAASVFSLAYSRFKDLTQARIDLVKLKEEKKRAEDALTELQNTQKQLVQTEKMASLGELTAGIAHEIQNPLNFVNNFSDVSNELIEEMKEELANGNTQQAMIIANDVKDNLDKILHHGKRADGIVKGMLQHSRSSSGIKEPTDINNLADEYLRLAYHGFRAKDKSFSAKFETNFDSRIEKLNVVPQDIGRVILNLINNAFYTVNEKKKQVDNGYEPVVTVSTKKIKDKIEISVKDNGNGIPQKVLNKIFQPFFTTKPTGQGTGLGLSLSFDIITKGHAGEIIVRTDEGMGAEFIISLPVN